MLQQVVHIDPNGLWKVKYFTTKLIYYKENHHNLLTICRYSGMRDTRGSNTHILYNVNIMITNSFGLCSRNVILEGKCIIYTKYSISKYIVL